MSTTKRIQGNYNLNNLELLAGQPPILKPKTQSNGSIEYLPSSLHPELYESIIRTSFLTVDGDLIVLGDTTVENIDEVSINDPVVRLNSNIDDELNETIDYIPYTRVPELPIDMAVAGIEINLGLQRDSSGDLIPETPSTPRRVNKQLRYNDDNYANTGVDTGYWEASDDGVDYYRLNSAVGFQLVNDPDPHLGGDLVVNGYKITAEFDVPAGNPGDIIIEADHDIVLDTKITINGQGLIKSNQPVNLLIGTSDPAVTPLYNTIYAKDPGAGGTGVYVTNNSVSDELVSRKQAIVFGLIF